MGSRLNGAKRTAYVKAIKLSKVGSGNISKELITTVKFDIQSSLYSRNFAVDGSSLKRNEISLKRCPNIALTEANRPDEYSSVQK